MESNPSFAVQGREGAVRASHNRQEAHYAGPGGSNAPVSDTGLSRSKGSQLGHHPTANVAGPTQHTNGHYSMHRDYGAHGHAQYHYSGQYHRSLPPPPPMRHYNQPMQYYGHPSVYGPPSHTVPHPPSSLPHHATQSKSFVQQTSESKRPLALHVHNPNLVKTQECEIPGKAVSETAKLAPVNASSEVRGKLFAASQSASVLPPKSGENPTDNFETTKLENISVDSKESEEVVQTDATSAKATFLDSAKKSEVKLNPLAMKSPVTLCFERMLGAAKYLAENPTPEVVRLDVSKKRKDVEISAIPRFEAASVAIAPPTATATEDFVNKRIKTSSRATAVPKMEYSSLEEGNPFLEIEHDSDLLHKVILQMALISEGKETKRTVIEPVSPVISEGFYWRDYPILEEILFDNMKNYYNMSSQNRQSRHQQEFNNRLVSSIRDAARENGYQFHPSFNDKRLRDRIRCFYKTHLQNAKKRLATLQKHPNSPIHQSHLRIYIRCVKQNMSVEDSEKLESNKLAPEVVVRNKSKNQESGDTTFSSLLKGE